MCKQCFAEVVIFVFYSGEAGEDAAADVGDVFVHFVHVAKGVLDVDEGFGVFLVGDEQQAGVELAFVVDAAGVGKGAAQDVVAGGSRRPVRASTATAVSLSSGPLCSKAV